MENSHLPVAIRTEYAGILVDLKIPDQPCLATTSTSSVSGRHGSHETSTLLPKGRGVRLCSG